jgi:exodeoxyribonuclease-3
LKIVSYNLNGIRSALQKGLAAYLAQENADIICFQELKAQEGQFDEAVFDQLGYTCLWHPAEKKGYSGVAILSKLPVDHVAYGCEHPLFHTEGRLLSALIGGITVVSAYFPSGTTGEVRQELKYEFLDYMETYTAQALAHNPLVAVCGDFNIANHDIDIHNPVSNKHSSGFLPEERAWLSKYFQTGMVDSFRRLNPSQQAYSWWSFRANARANNKGWRIDYIAVSNQLANGVQSAFIRPEAAHSDHCPIGMEVMA